MAGVLFEDIFNVKDIDPEGKKFDREYSWYSLENKWLYFSTNVSEVLAASIFIALMMEAVRTSEMLTYFYQITWHYNPQDMSQDSSVSIVTSYGLDDRGSIPDGGRGFFL
ncbi:DNA-directed RNA polymerases I, II, and III subunit RPABC3 [Zootermopsis nevadensis]|uniref:DNA-directed RNA polymerases I, II, and III subunit RPABC3 n=1 Tax=Zootermopsis nevadensis TaxID=136037 RepID=A0A067RPW6_ZOONE|nr:DNA-directed RNA polymerases I, II, and III subunit RPABC3 [Zootermopsis nevadensis]